MENKINIEKLLFSEPRLGFTVFLRFLWKLVYFSFYTIFSVATAVFLFSDIGWLKWLGVLFALFLLDRLIYVKTAKHSIAELDNCSLEGINTADYLSPKSFAILDKAFDKTLALGGNYYLHILKILAADEAIRGALWRMEISPEEFEQKIDEELTLSLQPTRNKPSENNKENLLEKTAVLTKPAFLKAYLNKSKFVEIGDLFAGMSFINDEAIKKIFYLFSISEDDLGKALIFTHYRWRPLTSYLFVPGTLGEFGHKKYGIRHRIMNRAWTARPTPTLDSYSYDLTDLARGKEIGFLVGHQKEYDDLVNVLSKPNNQNILLVGEPGSGKEAILNHLALKITKDKVPPPLFDKRLVCLRIGALIAGADQQEISRRANKIAQEIVWAGNVILYIPDIHNLVKTSGHGYMDVADILLPMITSDAAQVVGATYPRELKQDLAPRSDFINSFEIIRVEEISEDDAMTVLTYDSIILERKYGVLISFQAIKQAVVLARKYFRQKLLPLSAENLLKEALAEATQKGDKVLKAENIISIGERKINVPIHKAGKDEVRQLLDLENIIHKDLIDQKEAVRAVSESLREYRSGLGRTNGPIASFLFVGPTGVGKTELAKVLAKTQFGSENMTVRFDMSEYQDKQSIFRFIGSPDGKMSGALTEAITQKPYSIVLLDEFEKANPDVLNIFLQVFDDGRLTDNLGQVVDFRNTIIIATSNANSEYIKENLENGKKITDFKDEFKKKLTQYFKPELLNRFSDVIIFKNLSSDDIFQVAKIQLKKLAKIVNENQGIELQFDEAIIDYVAKKGFDPVFGARPLRGVISEEVKSPLAEKILKEEVIKGNTIKIEMRDGKPEMSVK
ncbi:MAG: ATP-dependent Clp protease ATP-binding subunit [Patescibacteria group bacterium]|nr:ATP-dependent Clp protease ATP-binding subunit [Patescibacteria group bacterium]